MIVIREVLPSEYFRVFIIVKIIATKVFGDFVIDTDFNAGQTP